jgi:hypothetical protein
MATMNKDLSPVDQARIILRNYDKVVAERDELKKENERLNMLVEQKDVLYRNMLERMEAKNKQSAIEGEYKHLKKQYDNLNEEYEKLKGARYTVEVVKQLCGSLKAYGNQLRKAGLNIDAIEELFDSSAEEESRESDMNSAYVGAYVALTTIKEYADSLNGTPADEWCKLMYKQICRQLDSITHGTDEEIPTGK